MDFVFLGDLRADAVIGINDTERRMPQRLIFDIEIGTELQRAAETDDLSQTIDYKSVADRVIEHASASRFQLLEALAESTAAILMNEFRARWCRIRITKRGVVSGTRDVGIVIERGACG
jgi:7,8-dihydroneopterin aldolase/epimerase/oxygenase